MAAFWESLSPVTRFFYFVAVPSTALLLFQTVLTIIGLGGSDADTDFDADAGYEFGGLDTDTDFDTDFDAPDTNAGGSTINELGDAGFRMFTMRGIVAFFAIFGWTGIVLSRRGSHVAVIGFVSLIAGLVAMIAVAALFYSVTKLQADGTMRHKLAVGQVGRVYIRVPARRSGVGKVQIYTQERLAELSAVTDDAEDILTGTEVVVGNIDGNSTLVVTRVNSAQSAAFSQKN